jgi:hypothetical protein
VYLAPAVFAQAVRDAEKRAGVSHDDALGVHIDDDEIDTYHARDVLGDMEARNVEAAVTRTQHERSTGRHRRSTNDAHNVRTFAVRLMVGDVEHLYRIDAIDPPAAARGARRAHADAGLKPSTACRVRLA